MQNRYVAVILQIPFCCRYTGRSYLCNISWHQVSYQKIHISSTTWLLLLCWCIHIWPLEMAGICSFYEEMEQQLSPTDVEEIKYLLENIPKWSKLHDYIILGLWFCVYWFFCKDMQILNNALEWDILLGVSVSSVE